MERPGQPVRDGATAAQLRDLLSWKRRLLTMLAVSLGWLWVIAFLAAYGRHEAETDLARVETALAAERAAEADRTPPGAPDLSKLLTEILNPDGIGDRHPGMRTESGRHVSLTGDWWEADVSGPGGAADVYLQAWQPLVDRLPEILACPPLESTDHSGAGRLSTCEGVLRRICFIQAFRGNWEQLAELTDSHPAFQEKYGIHTVYRLSSDNEAQRNIILTYRAHEMPEWLLRDWLTASERPRPAPLPFPHEPGRSRLKMMDDITQHWQYNSPYGRPLNGASRWQLLQDFRSVGYPLARFYSGRHWDVERARLAGGDPGVIDQPWVNGRFGEGYADTPGMYLAQTINDEFGYGWSLGHSASANVMMGNWELNTRRSELWHRCYQIRLRAILYRREHGEWPTSFEQLGLMGEAIRDPFAVAPTDTLAIDLSADGIWTVWSPRLSVVGGYFSHPNRASMIMPAGWRPWHLMEAQ